MTEQVAEIVVALALGVGFGAVFGPIVARFARRRWIPYHREEREDADRNLQGMQELREKLRVDNKARELRLRAEGRIKGG